MLYTYSFRATTSHKLWVYLVAFLNFTLENKNYNQDSAGMQETINNSTRFPFPLWLLRLRRFTTSLSQRKNRNVRTLISQLQ
ncbi:hypothetical protein GDO81_024585 [Engystomops pustulosus]|uniref:Uncharacterized protein n=1 Tax=Engystomops pustulosus TaxID=76066 RepID=A0AAV6ZMA6_ENGPU|nr:hypothetical protein GDO81_024585 [Engystomops pustulosus]